MRALILSDIHANLEALDAVLADAATQGGYHAVWCLGDLVGYGADPAPVIARLRTLPLSDRSNAGSIIAIAGNHDHAVTGQLNPDLFNAAARAAALWTTQQLTTDELKYLAALPQIAQAGNFTMAHGSLRDPILEYLISEPAARGTFARLTTPFCLVGHSHYPLIWHEGNNADAADTDNGRPFVDLLDPTQPLHLDTRQRLIINPGSVGQPRDGDRRASYLLFDDTVAADADGSNSGAGVIYHHRVEYDIATAQAKIRRAGLPESLAARLADGR